MTAADFAEQLKALDATLRNIEAVLDVDTLRRQKATLEEAASAPDLWDDQARAQGVTSKLSYVNNEIEKLEGLRRRLDDAGVLLELSESEDDAGVLGEVGTEIATLKKAIAYIHACHNKSSGGFAYQPGGPPGFARTAAGVCVLIEAPSANLSFSRRNPVSGKTYGASGSSNA